MKQRESSSARNRLEAKGQVSKLHCCYTPKSKHRTRISSTKCTERQAESLSNSKHKTPHLQAETALKRSSLVLTFGLS